MKLLLDVDRWDGADDAAQDAEVAKVRVDGFTHLRTERFSGTHLRVTYASCPSCYGGDCDRCGGSGALESHRPSVTLSHRVAVFQHASAGEFVLVPGRLEIAPCLVARVEQAGEPPVGLRRMTYAEHRHAVVRGGSADLEFESYASYEWKDHPFGFVGRELRFTANIPGAEGAQLDELDKLCGELGPVERGVVPGALVRTGYGTADPPTSATAIAFSRDGRWLATGHDYQARVWDASTGRQFARIDMPSGAVQSIAFSPDGLRLVITTDERVSLCEIAIGELVHLATTEMPRHKDPRRIASWRPDGRIVLVEAMFGHTRLSVVDPETLQTIRACEWAGAQQYSWISCAISHDGRRAATSVLHDGAFAIWNTDTLEVERHLAIDLVGAIALASDVVYVRAREKLYAFTPEPTEIGDERTVNGLACSPDGRFVASVIPRSPPIGIGLHDRVARRNTMLALAAGPVAFSDDGTKFASSVNIGSFVAIWPAPSS